MSGPNTTVASARNRKLVNVFTTTVATRSAADEIVADVRQKFPGATVRVTRFRMGPRSATTLHYAVRAYMKG